MRIRVFFILSADGKKCKDIHIQNVPHKLYPYTSGKHVFIAVNHALKHPYHRSEFTCQAVVVKVANAQAQKAFNIIKMHTLED